jgi:hypothetical protein
MHRKRWIISTTSLRAIKGGIGLLRMKGSCAVLAAEEMTLYMQITSLCTTIQGIVSAQDLKVLFVRVKYYRTPAQHIKLLARFDKAYEYSTIYNFDEDRDPGRWLDWHNMKADDFAAIPWLHSLGSHPYLRPLMYQLQNFFGNLYPPAFGPNVTIAAARTTVAATTVPDNVARLPKRRRHAVVPANAAPAEQRKAPIRRSVRCQHIHYIYLQATIAGRSAFLLSNMRHSKTS